MSNTELQKETAIQNEQQLKTKREIINDIIEILANNNLTITDSKGLLYETTKAICNQPVLNINNNTVHSSSRVCAEIYRFSMER